MDRIRSFFWFVVVIAGLTTLYQMFGEPTADQSREGTALASNQSASPTAVKDKALPDVTLGIFNTITPGFITYEQVSKILGPGTVVSESRSYGIVTTGYKWTNSDHSYMGLIFQNGRLVSKQQAGLR